MKPGSAFLFYFDIFMVLLQMGFWIFFYYSINQKMMSTKKKKILGIKCHVNLIHLPFVLRKMKVTQA